MESMYASIDLGTNACRLLIASQSSQVPYYTTIEAMSKPVLLAQGMLPHYRVPLMSSHAMERGILALRTYAKKIKTYGIPETHVRCVATQACRLAKNTWKFVQAVQKDSGLHVDVISAEEEAWLAVAGCAQTLNYKKKYAIIFDIGGGSTEITLCLLDEKTHMFSIQDWISVPYGVVTLSHHKGVEQKNIRHIQESLGQFIKKNNLKSLSRENKIHMIGASGTVTTLAAIIQKLPYYDRKKVHGVHLSSTAIHQTLKDIFSMTRDDLTQHPCIGFGRSDFMLSGLKIFQLIYKAIPTASVTVADRGVREGVLLELIQKNQSMASYAAS